MIAGMNFTHHCLLGAWELGGMIFVYDCAPSGHDVFDMGAA